MIDTYAVSEDDVVAQLQRVFEQPLDVDRIRVGDPAAGVEIELDRYLTTQADVVQQYLSLKRSFWRNFRGDDDEDEHEDEDGSERDVEED